jgi:hypothetical protein
MGPGVLWNGTAGSGYNGSPPADPARTTAKPRLQPWTFDQQRFTTDDFILGCYASAKGGISEVIAHVEGNSHILTVADVNVYTNAKGIVNVEVGYFVCLKASEFLAVSANGAINCYFEAIANDVTMQHRVMGPYKFYPRAVEFDWSKTFGVGGDYANPNLAMEALATAYEAGTATCGHIRGITSGSYPLTDALVTSANKSKGYTYMDASPGVTCNFVRGAAFDPVNTGGVWTYYCPLDNVCLGPGIKVDVKNFNNLHATSTRPWWMKGCEWTNSIGVRDTLYWNNAPHPGFRLVLSEGFGDVLVYWSDGAKCSYAGAPVEQAALKKFSYAQDCVAVVYFNPQFLWGNYERGSSVQFYRASKNMFSATYTGAGTGAMRIDRPGNVTLTLRKNGIDQVTFNLTTTTKTVGQLVAAINAYGNGFAATLLDGSYAAGAAGGASSGVVQALNTTPFIQTGYFDFHTEWVHVRYLLGLWENMVLCCNDIRDAWYATSMLNIETDAADADIGNNSWTGFGNSPQTVGSQHISYYNNTNPSGYVLYSPGSVYSYSEVFANLEGLVFPSPAYPDTIPVHDNIWELPGLPPATGNYVNNTAVAGINACLTDAANNDLRPTGVALLHNCTPGSPYDQTGNLRAATDAPGALAAGYPAREYAF